MSGSSGTPLAALAVVVASLLALLLVTDDGVRGLLAAGVIIAYFAYETRPMGLSRKIDKTERSAGYDLRGVLPKGCVGFLVLGVAMGSWLALGAAGVDHALGWVASVVIGVTVLRLAKSRATQAGAPFD